MFGKKMDRMRELLAMNWNADLIPTRNSQKDSEKEKDALPPAAKTPSKVSQPTVFYKFSPLNKGNIQKIQCPHCDVDYNLVRSVREHIKLKHQGMEDIDKTVTDPKGHCKLPSKVDETEQCGITFETHQINRHLKQVHKIVCPKGKALRGWLSKDNGLTWSPVFLAKTEPDPPYEIFIYEDVGDVKSQGEDVHGPAVVVGDGDHSGGFEAREDNSSGGAVASSGAGFRHRVVGDDELRDQGGDVDHTENDSAGAAAGGDHDHGDQDGDSDHLEDVPQEKVADRMNRGQVEENEIRANTVNSSAGAGRFKEAFVGDMEIEDEIEKDSLDNDKAKVSRNLFPNEKSSVSEKSSLLKVAVPEEQHLVLDVMYDSDTELNDSTEFTTLRILKKQIRYESRDKFDRTQLKEVPGNHEVYLGFKEYLYKKKVGLAKDKENDRNIDRILGHIVCYPDSLLAFETKKDQDFRLKNLTDFSSNECKELIHPLDWIQESCPENPNRAIEKLRAHSAFREYLLFVLSSTNMAGSFELMAKKTGLRDGLEQISKSIADAKLYKQYEKRMNNERAEEKEARFVVDPSHTDKEANSIKTWHESEKGKEIANKQKSVYSKAIKDRTIQARAFNSFANYVRFLLCLQDKNRAGGYSFHNKHFYARQKLYYPEGYSSFANLPDGWDPNTPPTPNAEPSMVILRLPGNLASLKGKEAVEVNVTMNMMRWLEMYRSLKELTRELTNRPQAESKDDCFFVNYQGKNLSEIKSSRGTIWQTFEEVTDVQRATITSCVRSAAEQVIQNNPEMANRVKRLNNHSAAVGSHVYDHNKYQYRAEFTNYMAKKDGETSSALGDEDEELTQKMKEREEEDVKQSKEEANLVLNRKKERKQAALSSQTRVKPKDREFLQKLLKGLNEKEFKTLFEKKFPGMFLF